MFDVPGKNGKIIPALANPFPIQHRERYKVMNRAYGGALDIKESASQLDFLEHCK